MSVVCGSVRMLLFFFCFCLPNCANVVSWRGDSLSACALIPSFISTQLYHRPVLFSLVRNARGITSGISLATLAFHRHACKQVPCVFTTRHGVLGAERRWGQPANTPAKHPIVHQRSTVQHAPPNCCHQCESYNVVSMIIITVPRPVPAAQRGSIAQVT